MSNNFASEVKLFMVFDILGDTLRSGPVLWQIERKRLEDIKNHALDLILIYKILEKYFPVALDGNKVVEYCICHDLPEAITGDITKFEGVSDEEITRVTTLAIDYLVKAYGDILDLDRILRGFEAKSDLEAKVVGLIDKLHSSTTFLKYECESHVDLDNPKIIPELRNHPVVVAHMAEGKDLGDMFYEFHMKSIKISDEECAKYGISREEADAICEAIKGFGQAMQMQKSAGTLADVKDDFPPEAMLYNRNR